MNEQPDKIFRDKLRGYQKPVSAEVWNRISANLGERKKNANLWLKIAAAILLLAVAGILLFNQLAQKPQQAIVKNEVSSPADNYTKQKVPASEGPTVAESSDETLPPAKTNTAPSQKKTKEPIKKSLPAPHRTDAAEKHAKDESDILPVIGNEDPYVETVTVGKQNANPGPVEQRPRVKLELNAEEVNAKYLNQNTLADATSEQKKPSTLRKLLDKAYDLKHNQDPLGDLRQKKNEIFALNFKSEKQRSENE